MQTIRIEDRDHVRWVWLNRPEKKNAFNDVMLDELREAFETPDDATRLFVLTGSGDAFCAGADLAWMAKSREQSAEENVAASEKLGDFFRVLNETPRTVVARVNGPAMGGALGLIACCDIVVAVDSVRFAFSEVRLGLAPAVISPFVLRKIGEANARRYFLSGEFFGADEARRMNLVHEVTADDGLDKKVAEIVATLRANGPLAMGESKTLIRNVLAMASEQTARYTAETIARLRVSDEGQEGLRAFIEKRKPAWRD